MRGVYSSVVENGILGVLKGSGASKSIMLRAEMDALPCVESPSNLLGAKKVCSLTEDAAHLCGHDFHQAILLAVAKVLSSDSVVFPGNIYFCFESGEETGEGVDAMVGGPIKQQTQLHVPLRLFVVSM